MQYIQNEFAEFWIDNEILFFVYKGEMSIDLDAAKKIVKDRLNLQQGVPYPVFCDLRQVKSSDRAARDYLAKEGSSLVKAVGVLIGSPLSKVMMEFYLHLNKPLTPTRIFTDPYAVLDYLDPYIAKNT